jgi:hypothetical protein
MAGNTQDIPAPPALEWRRADTLIKVGKDFGKLVLVCSMPERLKASLTGPTELLVFAPDPALDVRIDRVIFGTDVRVIRRSGDMNQLGMRVMLPHAVQTFYAFFEPTIGRGLPYLFGRGTGGTWVILIPIQPAPDWTRVSPNLEETL